MRRAAILLVILIASSFVPRVSAGQWNLVLAPTDFTIEILEASVFDARTVLCYPEPVGWCEGVVDSMLWIYSADGILLGFNDDAPNEYGSTWASHLVIELQPGTYRLRAGRCCGNPDAWRETDLRGYYLETSADAITPTPSPEPSPEPSVEPSPSPTPEPTPSPTPEPTPSPTPEPTPEPSPTPSPEPSVIPSPDPTPTATPTPTPTATPSPTPPPPPSPTEPPPSPTEPPPSPTEPPPTPTEPPPSVEPTAPPIELPSPDEVVAAVGEAVDAAVAAVGEVAAAYANLGADLSPAQREEMAAPVIASVIISQVGGAAVAAANAGGTRPGHRKGPQ